MVPNARVFSCPARDLLPRFDILQTLGVSPIAKSLLCILPFMQHFFRLWHIGRQGGGNRAMAVLRTDEFMQHALHDWEDMVYRLALSQVRNPADAADVCQETFISLLKDATAFQDAEHLKAWLIRVTVNRCKQLHRTAYRHRTQPLSDNETSLPQPPDVSDALLASEVWRALERLPRKYRTPVHLYYYEGYSTDEIAAILRCRPATVRSRLHRARAQLKSLMEEEGFHEQFTDGRVSRLDGSSRKPELGA